MIPSALVTSSQHLHQQRRSHRPPECNARSGTSTYGDPQHFLFRRYLGRWRQSDYLYILVQLVSAFISLLCGVFADSGACGQFGSAWRRGAGGAYTAKTRPQSDLMPGFVHRGDRLRALETVLIHRTTAQSLEPCTT